MVDGLRAAYDHPVFRAAAYAVFHTGLSATGDIDGVLIHGAQGVRSLTVVFQPRPVSYRLRGSELFRMGIAVYRRPASD